MDKIVETTRELIAKLKNGSYIMASDGEIVGCKAPTQFEIEAAERLEQLMQIIDDMYGDHYVDYLDWYTNRCHELEEEIEKLKEGRK